MLSAPTLSKILELIVQKGETQLYLASYTKCPNLIYHTPQCVFITGYYIKPA